MESSGKGRKRSWKCDLMHFNSSLQTAIDPFSEHLQYTWYIQQEQPYVRGFTVSCSEPSWSHSSVRAKRGPALPVPVHALPLLLPHQFQADLKLHWFQLPKVIDNKSSIWEAARKGVDTANFSLMKLLYISASISWKLPLIHLQSFWLKKKKNKPKQSTYVFLHLIQTNMFIFENTTMHTKASADYAVDWNNFKLH